MVPKSGHVTVTKIENLHIVTRRKIHWLQKCYSFRPITKNNEVIVENPFPNSGVTRRLWTLGCIDDRRQYILLVVRSPFIARGLTHKILSRSIEIWQYEQWSNYGRARGDLAHLKDLAAPAKHLFWEGSRGPVKGPLKLQDDHPSFIDALPVHSYVSCVFIYRLFASVWCYCVILAQKITLL